MEVEEVILGVEVEEVEASEVAEMVEDEAEVEEIANSRYVNIIFNIVRNCIQYREKLIFDRLISISCIFSWFYLQPRGSMSAGANQKPPLTDLNPR